MQGKPLTSVLPLWPPRSAFTNPTSMLHPVDSQDIPERLQVKIVHMEITSENRVKGGLQHELRDCFVGQECHRKETRLEGCHDQTKFEKHSSR